MGKKQKIIDLSLNSQIEDIFFLKEKEFKVRRDQKTIDLFFKLADSSGEMEAIIWDVPRDKVEKFRTIKFAQVKGYVTRQKEDGSLQATISSLIQTTPLDYSDYLPRSKEDPNKMMKVLREKIASVKNPHLKMLLESFFEDAGFVDKFKKAPAATKVHQPYLSGLLEHTLKVVTICEAIAGIYPEIERDFLITSAIIHDIGKIREYSYEQVIDHTDEGKLLGHITLGLEIVAEKIKSLPEFPPDLELMLKHTILSHHGHLEFGSPKLPSILAAIALHYADEMEAKISGFLNIKEENKDLQEKWSKWIWWLERPVYLEEEIIFQNNLSKKEEER
ncbi:MAG: HD domain-containing protein [Candidatus Caldatribacteriota bacterium]